MGDRHDNEDDRIDQGRQSKPEPGRAEEPVRAPEPQSELGDAPDARISPPGVEISDAEPVTTPANVPRPGQAAAPEREIRRVERDLNPHAAGAKTTPGGRSGSWWRRLWNRR
jgi:hypothetical protein